MILHAADAVQEGHRKIVLRTVDTDVLVSAIALAGRLQEQQVELWVAMETGSHLRYIAAHEISHSLGSEMSKSIPVFTHSLDAMRCPASLGEARRPLLQYQSYPAVTDAFLQLATTPTPLVSEACMIYLERFVILLYDRTSNKANANEARKQLFAQKGRAYDAQHTKRTAYQGGHCWGQAPTLTDVTKS